MQDNTGGETRLYYYRRLSDGRRRASQHHAFAYAPLALSEGTKKQIDRTTLSFTRDLDFKLSTDYLLKNCLFYVGDFGNLSPAEWHSLSGVGPDKKPPLRSGLADLGVFIGMHYLIAGSDWSPPRTPVPPNKTRLMGLRLDQTGITKGNHKYKDLLERLASAGIHTIADLARLSREQLRNALSGDQKLIFKAGGLLRHWELGLYMDI